MKGGGNKIQS